MVRIRNITLRLIQLDTIQTIIKTELLSYLEESNIRKYNFYKLQYCFVD